jgi:putative tricarboxylic transport membrane protein
MSDGPGQIDRRKVMGSPLSSRRQGALARLRSDHVAGVFFVAFGCAIIALSGDLPMGSLSFPGSGFLPKIVASLLIFFGAIIVLRGGDSQILAVMDWTDVKHAGAVILISAAAVALYTNVGFIVTFLAMILTLLLLVERRNPVRAAFYALVTTAITYGVFVYGLKAPLPPGPLGF